MKLALVIEGASCPKYSKVFKNLTNPHRALSKDEVEVLELGLTFCPSAKDFNKEELTEDTYWFIHRLKLKEFFFQKKNDITAGINNSGASDIITGSPECNEEQKWESKNSEWYPEEVRNNRSEALTNFIRQIFKDMKMSFNDKKNKKFFNNLDDKKRKALHNLSKDTSIVIKKSDKCGSIVIMSTTDYEKACLEQLQNKTFYEEVESDENITYAEKVRIEVEKLKQQEFINEKQYNSLTSECKTPTFYGLPKMHKVYENFPSLRPICSGTGSPTAKLSQFVDNFLKTAAKNTCSYIKDTTHFILRTKDINVNTSGNKSVFLGTMDVTSLYPNIDHDEGTSACMSFLEQQNPTQIPLSIIKRLILLILQSNTMQFMGKFFHQIKGTAMGTAMAVNYANLFMARFEQKMLEAYHNKTGLRPKLWLRFVDDIFFMWEGDESSLKHFLQFCNNFSEQEKMKSTIKFTYSYSTNSVNFLDTTVFVMEDGSIGTDLYAKPTAAYQYLHQSSYHDPHLIKAIPKSQFIRIRRICSTLNLYWKHTDEYIKHFAKRGYQVSYLKEISAEIASKQREEFLFPKEQPQNERIPLVITYHHKFREISKILHKNYKTMITQAPNMKKIFPQPPMVAFKRNANIKDKIMRAKH